MCRGQRSALRRGGRSLGRDGLAPARYAQHRETRIITLLHEISAAHRQPLHVLAGDNFRQRVNINVGVKSVDDWS